MSDLPKKVHIHEEGPREGFQIEKGPIATARKIELIDALSETGLEKIQVASFVSPKAVPGWADADDVVRGFKRKPGIKYHVLWLNEKGLQRALMHQKEGAGLDMFGSISTTASETFMRKNTNRGYEDNVRIQGNQIKIYQGQHFQGLKSVAPESCVLLEPLLRFGKRFRVEMTHLLATLALARNQGGLLEAFDVFGGAREGHRVRFPEFANAARTLLELPQHGTPGWIGQGTEDCVQAGRV